MSGSSYNHLFGINRNTVHMGTVKDRDESIPPAEIQTSFTEIVRKKLETSQWIRCSFIAWLFLGVQCITNTKHQRWWEKIRNKKLSINVLIIDSSDLFLWEIWVKRAANTRNVLPRCIIHSARWALRPDFCALLIPSVLWRSRCGASSPVASGSQSSRTLWRPARPPTTTTRRNPGSWRERTGSCKRSSRRWRHAVHNIFLYTVTV